jgi:Vps54-like protein.
MSDKSLNGSNMGNPYPPVEVSIDDMGINHKIDPNQSMEVDNLDNNHTLNSIVDDTINLNDDLGNESEYSSTSLSSPPTPSYHRSGSILSARNSMDGESVLLSSMYYNILHPNETSSSSQEFSPLGPNSIYELTIASDQARIKRNKPPRSSVTINGGSMTIANLKAPTTRDIPQIHLKKLHKRIQNDELEKQYVENCKDEYKNFELSYKLLTEDTLERFTNNLDSFGISSSHGDLSAIPSVFLTKDFRLDDPRVFKKVIGNSMILPKESDDPNSHLVNNTELQEKLSHYLDLVEINLIKEIEKSSESFFSTIGDIENIQLQTKKSVQTFEGIKKKLDILENENSIKGSKIINNLIKKKNTEHLESSLLQLQYVVSMFELANKSFNNGKYSKCLNEIVIVEYLIKGVEYDDLLVEDLKDSYPKFLYPLVNLSSLPALVHLRNDLQNLKDECSKGYINDFVYLLLDDLRNHYKEVPTQDTLNRMYVSIDRGRKHSSRPVNTSYSIIEEAKKKKLAGFIKNLVKASRLTQAFASYQEKIIVEIKDIIKQYLPSSGQINFLQDISNTPSRNTSPPESSGNTPQPGGGTLSSNIKSLTPKEFELMLSRTYSSLSECLRRLTAHQKVLLDLALTAIPQSDTIDVMSLDLSISINKAIELTQIRLTKIINVRLEQTADLTVPFYLRLYSISSAYLQECELMNPGYAASGAGSSLSEWFKHHISYFVHRFHLNSLKFLVADCDREVWREVTQTDVLSEHQIITDEIIGYSDFVSTRGASGFSGESWLKVLDFYEDETSIEKVEIDPTIEKLKIVDESFTVPNLTLKSLKQVKNYLILSKVFPNTLPTIENNLLNYFKLMNSKASQAVLNAGATRTAGLKNIKTRNIALCIQLVEFNIAFLSQIQSIFKPNRDKQVLFEEGNTQAEDLNFERILSNYKDHESELFSKLVSIMYNLTVTHCATLSTIDWSEPIKYPNQCHPYMETLVKNTVTVTNVLFKYLPELKCSLILLQIFDNYKKLFVECFCTQLAQFKDFNEKQTALKDIDYFRVKLCELPGYGNSGQVIWENIHALPTVEDTRMEEVMRNNIEGERIQNLKSAENSKKNSLDVSRNLPALPKETTVVTGLQLNKNQHNEADINNKHILEQEKVGLDILKKGLDAQETGSRIQTDTELLFSQDMEAIPVPEETKPDEVFESSIPHPKDVDSNTDGQVSVGKESDENQVKSEIVDFIVPEVAEPEVIEPEVAEPEVTEPEVTEPEDTVPEVTVPEAPKFTETEVPKVTETKSIRPETEVTRPESTEPIPESDLKAVENASKESSNTTINGNSDGTQLSASDDVPTSEINDIHQKEETEKDDAHEQPKPNVADSQEHGESKSSQKKKKKKKKKKKN